MWTRRSQGGKRGNICTVFNNKDKLKKERKKSVSLTVGVGNGEGENCLQNRVKQDFRA